MKSGGIVGGGGKINAIPTIDLSFLLHIST
jgi:hypothetical protein